MLPLACLCLALALASVTVIGQAHPALANTRASDSGSSEESLDMAVFHSSGRETASNDTGMGSQLSQYVLDELRKTKNLVSRLQALLGSTYIRWGRKSCPAHTTLVYTGVAGGKWYHKATPGGGTNPLCLTNSPQFDNTYSNGAAASTSSSATTTSIRTCPAPCA